MKFFIKCISFRNLISYYYFFSFLLKNYLTKFFSRLKNTYTKTGINILLKCFDRIFLVSLLKNSLIELFLSKL
jgi:hypothetical protein